MDNLSWLILVLFLALVFYIFLGKNQLLSANKKVIIITGCDSGIGFETARVFHSLGFTVFAGCLFPNGAGARQLNLVPSDRLIVLDLDITNKTKVDDAVKQVTQHCQQNNLIVWCLINNAGISIGGDVEWQTWEHCKKQVNDNFLGMVRMIKAFLPAIKTSKGRVVNISSILGRWANPRFTIYCATKFAIEGFSDGLRMELSRHDVRVIVIAPGDHVSITNIAKCQQERAKEQWDSFSPEYRDRVGKEFWEIHSQLCACAGFASFTKFEQSPLFRDLKSAVMETKPKQHYTSASLKHRIFCYVLRHLPTTVSDFLILKVNHGIMNYHQIESIRPQ